MLHVSIKNAILIDYLQGCRRKSSYIKIDGVNEFSRYFNNVMYLNITRFVWSNKIYYNIFHIDYTVDKDTQNVLEYSMDC